MLRGEALSKAGVCAHRAMCPQGQVENNEEEKKQKPREERDAGRNDCPQQPRRHTPRAVNELLFRTKQPTGVLFSEPWLSGGVGTGGTQLSGELEQVVGWAGMSWARGLSPGVSVVAEMSIQTRSERSDQRRGARKASGRAGHARGPWGMSVQPIRQVQRSPFLLLPVTCPCGSRQVT